MDPRKHIRKHWLKYLIGFIAAVLMILIWKKEEIAENMYSKAKIEMFKALLDKDYDKAKSVLDSLR